VAQSGNSGLADKALGELALRIEAELPEEIMRYIAFGQDAEAKNLVVDWAVQLSTEDLKLLTDVITGYGGCYTNLKDDFGRDRGVFLVPGNQPPPAITPDGDKLTKENPTKSSKDSSKAPAQSGQEIKQQSPLMLFQERNCSCCSDQGTCTPRTSAGRQRLTICFKTMELNYFDFIAERLNKLCQIQDDKCKILPRVYPQDAQSKSNDTKQPLPCEAKPIEPSPQPTPMTVQRNTRPEQGHIDKGIVWTFEVGSRGEYEKAIEKDNQKREAYSQLFDWIRETEKPFKDNYFYWIFDQGASAIGRKKTKLHRGSR
jgi:hypothetical protein